jgi:hypothetical protein
MLVCALSVMPALAAETPEGQPVADSEDRAGEIVETETGIYYTVQKGDTLWGLSRKFSDSPYLWPDLWSGNPQIANPHRIYPGERIRLYRREDVSRYSAPAPPEPVVEETPTPAALPEMQPLPEVADEPEAPGPEENLGLFKYSKIDQVGFIREVPVEPHGRIFKVREPKKMIATDDIVYIDYESHKDLIPGKRYTVYRLLETVRDRNTDAYLGVQHYLVGVLEVVQTEPDYAVGRITTAFSNIRVDDLLMPYERRKPKIPRRKSPAGLKGEIIMAEEHNLIIGDNVTAFINKGEKDGVRPGQTYKVYYQIKDKIQGRLSDKKTFRPEIFGEFLVLHTENTTSTVFITSTRTNISPGTDFLSPR